LSPPSPTRTSKVVPAETDPTTAAAAIAVVKRMMIESLKVEGEVVEEEGLNGAKSLACRPSRHRMNGTDPA
jgi:hypothetical protein